MKRKLTEAALTPVASALYALPYYSYHPIAV
jgi:hypothetical protein